MVAAVICWAIYTLGSRRLVSRHSPVGVTGLSMAIGTLIYVPVMWRHVRAVDWLALSGRTWIAVVYSAIFALGVAYTIWYAAVRQIGSARTSVYSNVIPIVAMGTAVVFLGESLTWTNAVGAAAVLLGVALTRMAPQVRTAEPCDLRVDQVQVQGFRAQGLRFWFKVLVPGAVLESGQGEIPSLRAACGRAESGPGAGYLS